MSDGVDLRPEEYQDDLGNDVTLIDHYLAKTPTERLVAWEQYANFVLDLRVKRVPADLPAAEPAPPRR